MALSHFTYAQARLQARYGQQPDETEWQRLQSITAFSHLLQTARNGTLRPWLLGIGPHSNGHFVEDSLRRQLRQHITEVAHWLPAAWHPAVHWCAVLPDLPALQHLLAGHAAPPWTRDDARLKPCTHDLAVLRLQALRESAYAPLLLPATAAAPDLTAAWLHEWRRRWPTEATATDRRALDALVRDVAAYRQTLAEAEHGSSDYARTWLERRLRRAFRRQPRQAATAFIYLALCALQLERLRGMLLRLILFPAGSPPP